MNVSSETSSNLDLATRHSTLFYFGPPLLWMAAMYYFSTDSFSADNTGSRLEWVLSFLPFQLTQNQYEWVHFLLRKGGHVTEYGLLALLWLRAFRRDNIASWQWRWAVSSFGIIALWALLDEWHQSHTARRTGSIYDSLLDMSGGATALLLWWLWRGRKPAISQSL